MTSTESLFKKIQSNTQNITLTSREFNKILRYYGFTLIKQRGSHKTYIYQKNDKFYYFIYPSHSDGQTVKKVYIIKFVELLDIIERENEND